MTVEMVCAKRQWTVTGRRESAQNASPLLSEPLIPNSVTCMAQEWHAYVLHLPVPRGVFTRHVKSGWRVAPSAHADTLGVATPQPQ